MDVVYPRCCGIDIHKKTAVACTGVYWKAPFNLLEGQFQVVLANAQHIKAVPGRKTDVKDAEWIADLLRHGAAQGELRPGSAAA